MSHSLLGRLAVYSALVVSLGAALRANRGLRISTALNSEAIAETRRLNSHEQALVAHLSRLEVAPLVLEAEKFIGGMDDEVMRLGLDSADVILYRLRTDCRYCPSNYDLLAELAGQGIEVVGLAIDTVAEAVLRHHQSWGLPFPVAVSPSGSVMRKIPAFSTPTTIVLSRGEVLFLEFGVLSATRRMDLREVTRDWAESIPNAARQ